MKWRGEIFKLLIIAGMCCILGCGLLYADQDVSAVDIAQSGLGARPLALGKAFVGLADDANAIFMNPAGTAYFSAPKALNMRNQLLQDVSYTTYALAWPTNFGTFGLGYVEAAVENIYVASWDNIGNPVINGEATYVNNVTILSYANKLNSSLGLGVSLKQYSQQFASLGVKNAAAQGNNLDIGLLYRISNQWSAGVMYRNILTRSMIWESGYTESIDSALHAGISYRYVSSVNWFDITQMTYAFDVVLPQGEAPRLASYHLGSEIWWANIFAVRLGAGTREEHISGGVASLLETAFGIGTNFWGIQFDYTYMPGALDLGDKAAKSFFSLSYQLPEITKETVSPRVEKQRQDKEPAKVAALAANDIEEKAVAKNPIMIKVVAVNSGYDGNAQIINKVLRKNIITARDILGDRDYSTEDTWFQADNGERTKQLRLNPGENWFSYVYAEQQVLVKIMLFKDYADVSERTPGQEEIKALTLAGVMGWSEVPGNFAPYANVDSGDLENALALINDGKHFTERTPWKSGSNISRREALMKIAERFGGSGTDYLDVFAQQIRQEIEQGNSGGMLQRHELAALLMRTAKVRERLVAVLRDYDISPQEVYLTGVLEGLD